jgi:hypothetical protein
VDVGIVVIAIAQVVPAAEIAAFPLFENELRDRRYVNGLPDGISRRHVNGSGDE